MANSEWRAKTAKCPYYKSSTDRSVTCGGEGLCGDVIRRLPTGRECNDWFRRHCATHYRGCPVYRMVSGIVEGDA